MPCTLPPPILIIWISLADSQDWQQWSAWQVRKDLTSRCWLPSPREWFPTMPSLFFQFISFYKSPFRRLFFFFLEILSWISELSVWYVHFYFDIFKNFLTLFILREIMSGVGAERENPKQALHCQHRSWCQAQSHNPWDHDLKPRVRHLTDWATQAPRFWHFS